ncbi:MAG: radical SAM protein [archaeon]
MEYEKYYLKLRNYIKRGYYRFHQPKKLFFPEIMSIELSTICNAKCKFCPHSEILKRDSKRFLIMPENIFKKIINESMGHKELKLIKPSLYGEPALTPHIFERLRYIREKLPKVKIKLISNGSEMNSEKIDIIFNENLCDEINFSLDADKKETFEEFKNISWDKVIANINYFIEKNNGLEKPIKIVLSFVCTPENKGQLGNFKKRWRGRVQKFHIGSESGLLRRKNYINKRTSIYCSQIFDRINFLSDGRAVLCCLDPFGEVIVGNINNQTVSEIWNGPILKKIRGFHLRGDKNMIPLCSKCDEWY